MTALLSRGYPVGRGIAVVNSGGARLHPHNYFVVRITS